jgi:protein MAK16
MQHDDLIWRSVGQGFCSFKVKTVKQNFCRNKYNLTGLCSRAGCPLANSKYATIVESGEALYLFIKTAERAHSPRNLWQKIRLSANYNHALSQIDKHLEHWPEFYVHKAKQRLTKMVQYHIRRRRIALRTKTRLVGIKKKVERREKSREAKAVAAAKLDKAIEKELLERLRSGAYGDIYNFPQEQYEKVLEEEEALSDEEDYDDDVDSDEFEADYEEEGEGEGLDLEDGAKAADAPDFDFDSDSNDSGDDDDEEADGAGKDAPEDAAAYVRARAKRRLSSQSGGKGGKGKKGRPLRKTGSSATGGVRVEVEYEHEKETGSASQRR